MNNQIVISRYIDATQLVVKCECAAGTITLLNDENGAEVPAYISYFSNQETNSKIRLEYAGKDVDSSEIAKIGFQDTLPDDIGAKEFLLRAGFSAERVESLLDSYELRKTTYLTCSQLSATVGRQLLLLTALASTAKVLVLNDPFLPFNGRWRDSFAEMLLNDAREKGRIVVILNLSFIPQCWIGKTEIKALDLGKIADQALQKALMVNAKELAKQQGDQPKPIEKKPVIEEKVIKEATDSLPMPEFVSFAYKQTSDYIFEPLANFSRSLRQGGIAIMCIGMLLVMSLIAVTMAPNLGANIQILKTISQKFSFTTSDVIQAAVDSATTPKPKLESAPLVTEETPLEAVALETSVVPEENEHLELSDEQQPIIDELFVVSIPTEPFVSHQDTSASYAAHISELDVEGYYNGLAAGEEVPQVEVLQSYEEK